MGPQLIGAFVASSPQSANSGLGGRGESSSPAAVAAAAVAAAVVSPITRLLSVSAIYIGLSTIARF